MGLLNQTQQQYYNSNNFGNYQFTSLEDIINNFMATYVGEEKILPRTKRGDVSFHAHRALQELSFDTFKSCKSQEITVPSSLQMILPQDYVNYVKLTWSDASGIEHVIYPTSKTSNPGFPSIVNSISAFGRTTNGSPVVVLDGQYDDIIPGMSVNSNAGFFGSLFSSSVVVESVSLAGGITTIVMDTNLNITLTANQQSAPFEFTSNSLIVKDLVLVDNNGGDFDAGDTFVYWPPNTSLSHLEVGMEVVHENIPSGTIITSLFEDGNAPSAAYLSAAATGSVGSSGEGISFKHANNANNANNWYKNNTSTTASNYKSSTPSENQDDYQDDTYWPIDGSRFGLDPQHAQANGSFFIDCKSGKIHFSSNIAGKTVILHYISDSLGTDGEMQVHKFAEEAVYKWIIYGCISARIDIPEYVIKRFKKERFAETRKAKLRLSNIKLEEITQILRGKSKQIKH